MEGIEKAIVFVADFWGSEKGGVNVVNLELCSSMGYIVTGKTRVIALILNGIVSDMQIEKAKRNNVYIVRYQKDKNEEKLHYDLIVRKVLQEGGIKRQAEMIWVGHDIHTGNEACELSKYSKTRLRMQSIFALIIHTPYNLREGFKEHGQRLSKLGRQEALLLEADHIFCVGPLLKKLLKDEYHIQRDIDEIIPGLTSADSAEGCGRYHILTYGYVLDDSDIQKNWKEVCWALAKALKRLGPDKYRPEQFPVVVCGLNDEAKKEKLYQMAKDMIDEIEDVTGVRITLELHNFQTDRRKLLSQLKRSKLFVLNSELESFSLSAWEAISMGIPVIVTESSGVYYYLESRFGYLANGLCGVIRRDIEHINRLDRAEHDNAEPLARVLRDIIDNLPKMEYSTKYLLKELQDCTWTMAAAKMAKALRLDYGEDFIVREENNCYETVYYKRETVFNMLYHQAERFEITNRIIFFGGIATRLTEGDFTKCLLKLMSSGKGRKLDIYYCYETEEAIRQREEMQALEGMEQARTEEKREKIRKANEEKQRKKAERIIHIKEVFQEEYEKLNLDSAQEWMSLDSVLSRIHIIPLKKSPAFYFNIIDEDMYIGFKYETRSSVNTTATIKNEEAGLAERRRVLSHMSFVLQDSEKTEDCKRLMALIEKLRASYEERIKRELTERI